LPEGVPIARAKRMADGNDRGMAKLIELFSETKCAGKIAGAMIFSTVTARWCRSLHLLVGLPRDHRRADHEGRDGGP